MMTTSVIMATMENLQFRVKYRSWTALRKDIEEQMSMWGLLLRTEIQAELYTPVELNIIAPDGRLLEFKAQVLQHIPGQGLALKLEQTDPEVRRELEAWLAVDIDDAVDGEDPKVRLAGEESPEQPESAIQKIDQMTVTEKRRAALRGKKDMRTLLIRDRNKTIHPFILKNPSITLDEIEQIAKMPGVNPDVLRLIARNRDWTRSTTVVRNLVRNPKTPMKEALTLLKKLPKNDIRAMAKTGNVRTAIQTAARKIVREL
ncbi:MAG: hypothetical protein JRF33_01165 [Deltaproteobacteria bacterium]|nr:hypothetical protein [Deltaproteobacteria bacterium]